MYSLTSVYTSHVYQGPAQNRASQIRELEGPRLPRALDGDILVDVLYLFVDFSEDPIDLIFGHVVHLLEQHRPVVKGCVGSCRGVRGIGSRGSVLVARSMLAV